MCVVEESVNRASCEPRPRLLFASYHCYVDPSSGAAAATRDLLELLLWRGWETRVFCGPALDLQRPESLQQLLSDQEVRFEERRCSAGPIRFSVFDFEQNGVPASVYAPFASVAGAPSREEGLTFLALFQRALDQFRPDILLTYGGHWLAGHTMRRARQRGAAVVFALHNLEYRDARLFEDVDAVLVPSRFCAEHYRCRLGLRCAAIPSPLNWSRVHCDRPGRGEYVTFVNPQPTKGAFVFVRIGGEEWEWGSGFKY